MAMCDANVQAKCEANADASVQCEGKCEGSAEPPQVKAECEATVEAKANASVECTPPQLDISYQWSASLMGDATAQAEFKAWLQGFRGQFSALIAANAKAELVLDAAAAVGGAATGAVQGAVDDLTADANIAAAFKAKCAIDELANVPMAIGTATGDLMFGVTAFADISGAVSGN